MSTGTIQTLLSTKKQGFLLIELLIALAMISIIALGVGGYHHHIMANHLQGKNRLQAVSIARTTLEHICAGSSRAVPSDIKPFTVESVIAPPDKNGFSAVQVTVSWPTNQKAVRSVTLNSGVCRENA